MIWGLSLHGWEDLMRGSLLVVGVFGLIAGLSTWFVVKLQRAEIEQSAVELEEYKSDAAVKVEEAKKEGIEAGKTAGNALVRAAELEREAASARLETEKLKKEFGWRDVTAAQAQQLAELLSGKSMQIVLHWGMGDAEASNFTRRLAEALTKAGLQIIGGSPIGQLGEERHGLSVAGYKGNEVEALTAALNDVGFGPVNPQIVPAPSGPNVQYTDIFVGYRVAPKL